MRTALIVPIATAAILCGCDHETSRTVGAAVAGLSGPESAAQHERSADASEARAQWRASRDATYKYLVANGITPEAAEAAVLNPQVLDAVMREIAERKRSGGS